MRKTENMLGGWAFLIGVVIAILFGAFGILSEGIIWTLVVIGILVGFLNIAAEEAEPFLISGAVLIIASAFGETVIGASPIFGRILSALLTLFVPATIIVAVRNVFSYARR